MAMLELSLESGEDSLSVRSFSVHEAMSTLFTAEVIAVSPNEDIDLESLVGRKAEFRITSSLGATRTLRGLCSNAEQTEIERPEPGALGVSTYSIQIVPTLWLTTQRKNNRMFQRLTTPAIVEKILAEYGIKAKRKLVEPHPTHELRVQYGETDFAFISRLLEEEGIAFYFDEDLVLSDNPHTGEARKPITFADNPNESGGHEFVTEVRVGNKVRPGQYTIRDYDFEKPDYKLVASSEKAKPPEDFYEQYIYEHGAFTDDKSGKARADVALQADRLTKRSVSFTSNAFDLMPGSLFQMEGHPRADLGEDARLLVVEAMLEGSVDGEWSLTGEAAFADAPYRPQQRTQKPKVSGLQSAVVVGPAGEEIYTDEHGRVRVQFHWDREGKRNENSTCWVRVSQGWAGAAFGMTALPRVGQEVLVSFWEGNPDQPLVVGRLYNGKNLVPYKLPDEKTKSTWKSSSSPSTGGFNEIMFDDNAGKELVYIQAERDMSQLVKRHETERTGADRTMIVGSNRSSVVGKTDTTLVGEKFSVTMISAKDLHIAKMGEPDFSPLATTIEMVDGKITLTTGKASVTLDGSTITLNADGDIKIKAGGEVVIQGGPFVKINC